MLEKVWRKGNLPTLLVGMEAGVATMENNMEVPQKTKNRTIIFDPAIPLLGIYLDKIIIHKETCTLMFIAALFTIATTWKQPNVHQHMNG